MAKKYFCFIFIIFSCVAWVSPRAARASDERIIMDALKFTVMIKTRVFIGLGGDDKTTEVRPYLGSGIVIDTDKGLILTSRHVVTQSPAEINVFFHSREKVEARRVYVDPQMDVAVIKVDPKAVKYAWAQAEFDNIRRVLPGHPVLAFGHPLGYEFSASRGIISSETRREVGYGRFYQSDTVIGGGNSGGPLISLRTGRVLGMNTYRSTGDGTQLTFSLYADDFLPIVKEARSTGDVQKVKRGEVGIRFVRVDDKRLPWYLRDTPAPQDLFSQGMFVVASVRPNGPGEKAGFLPFDLLYQIGSILVSQDTIDAANRYVDSRVGQTVDVKMVRAGEMKTLRLFVDDAEKDIVKRYGLVTGVAVHDVNTNTPGYAISDQKGVEIADIMDDAPGDRGTLRRFDVIKAINGKQVNDLDDFMAVMREVPEGQKAEVLYQRFTRTFHVGFGISQLEVVNPRMLNVDDPFPVN